jgi:rare lipoprotein A
MLLLTGPSIEGTASYYTTRECGPITASGERLDDSQYTCAMRKGKFGDYYLVTASNGRSVIVKLNDRGPYVKGRVVDLSEAAMRALSPDEDLIEVTIRKISNEAP